MRHSGTSRKLFSTLALLAGLAALGAAPAANAAALLRGYMAGVPSSSLSKGDWDAFQGAAQMLLSQIPSTPGQSQNWTGPSGASGTLTIKDIFERHDMPCRKVNALFNSKTGSSKTSSGGSNYLLTVCRDSNGNWKIVN